MAPVVKLVSVVVSFEAPDVLSIQAMLASVPHPPLNTCNTASLKVPGVTVTIWLDPVAVKEYQTSSSAPLPMQAACDCVAATVVPDVLVVQVVEGLTVKDTAPEQSLLAGAPAAVVTQMVKLPVVVP